MKSIKALSVIGTRPEAIKMAPVVNALAAEARIESLVCVTGQHQEMLESVLSLFQIAPTFNLNLMRHAQNLTDLTSRVLVSMRDVLARCKPDVLLVQGDTTSAMAASLAAFYHRVPVCHVEAGLRTGDIYSPWPEELNRRVTSVIADLHFAPTPRARENLLREGIVESKILVTGNTVVDALQKVLSGIEGDQPFIREMHDTYSFLRDEGACTGGMQLVLVTGHRRESFGAGFERICLALGKLASRKDVQLVYPVHLNPNVREPVHRILGGRENVFLLEPLEYRRFVYLMSRARFILTDSGGIQEEAPSLGKPVLVMRDVTEREEAMESGNVVLVGTDDRRILEESERLLNDRGASNKVVSRANPFGDGRASERIVSAVLERYGSAAH